MKKITAVLLIAALMLTSLSGCLPVEVEPGGAGMAPEGEVSREAGPAEEPEATRDPNVYDPVVSSAHCADHKQLREIIINDGIDVPEEAWWMNEEKVNEVFEVEGGLSAGCLDGVVDFYFSCPDGFFWLYVTLMPREEPIEMSWLEELEWEPMDGHNGYEQMKAENGFVLLRWQWDECQFGAKVPEDSIDKFLEHNDQLWERVKLREPGVTPRPIDKGADIVASVPESSGLTESSSVAYYPDPADSPFPLWEDAEEPVMVEGIVMELVSMEDMHLDEEPDRHEPYLDWKVLKVQFELEEELWNPEPLYLRIDHLYDGTWHTVYRPWDNRMRAGAAWHIGPGECEREFAVPACALWRSGEYRICHEDLGTLYFTME